MCSPSRSWGARPRPPPPPLANPRHNKPNSSPLISLETPPLCLHTAHSSPLSTLRGGRHRHLVAHYSPANSTLSSARRLSASVQLVRLALDCRPARFLDPLASIQSIPSSQSSLASQRLAVCDPPTVLFLTSSSAPKPSRPLPSPRLSLFTPLQESRRPLAGPDLLFSSAFPDFSAVHSFVCVSTTLQSTPFQKLKPAPVEPLKYSTTSSPPIFRFGPSQIRPSRPSFGFSLHSCHSFIVGLPVVQPHTKTLEPFNETPRRILQQCCQPPPDRI
ncbi:hypothetical protein ACJZ2D_015565 [Fusarium nematophilum]